VAAASEEGGEEGVEGKRRDRVGRDGTAERKAERAFSGREAAP
jgi:hypothetical protein